ncbi:MAG: hypothetical protein ACLQRH_08875 [Acidimicrobiales bacterium]|jgi:hypothetical protein
MQTAGINVGGAVSVGVAAGTGLIALFILLFVIIVVANRAEPDPRGLRPLSVYLFAMTFVMLELAYSGTVLIVTSLFSLIGPHAAPLTNSVARSVVIGAILLVIAGSTMVIHLRKGLEIARGDGRADGPNARILHTYVSVVTFLYLVTALVSLGLSIYFLFELISPAVFGGGGAGRSAIVEILLDVLYIMVASGLIVIAHSTLGGPSILRFNKGEPAGLSVDPNAAE